MPRSWDDLYSEQAAAGTLPSQLTRRFLTAPLPDTPTTIPTRPKGRVTPTLPVADYCVLLWEWFAQRTWTIDRIVRENLDPMDASEQMEKLLRSNEPILARMLLHEKDGCWRYGGEGAFVKDMAHFTVSKMVKDAYHDRWTLDTNGVKQHAAGKPLITAHADWFLRVLGPAYDRDARTMESWQFRRWLGTCLGIPGADDALWPTVYRPDYRVFVLMHAAGVKRIYTANAIKKFLDKEVTSGDR